MSYTNKQFLQYGFGFLGKSLVSGNWQLGALGVGVGGEVGVAGCCGLKQILTQSMMKQFKITKATPIEQTIKKISRKAEVNNGRQRPQLTVLNRTARSVAEQKHPGSHKPSPRRNSSRCAESPVNIAATKYDNYFRFIKDEKIKLNLNQTCLWNRAVKTPMPVNYMAPRIDEKRRSVMDEKRYKRASESPYQRSNKDKNVKKKLEVHGEVIAKKRAETPKTKDNNEKSSRPSVDLLEEEAQKNAFEGIEFFRDLGRGAHALVRSAVDWKHNRKIAVKVYRKTDLTEDQLCNIQRQVEILQEIDHPGIAMLYDIIETPQTINLVMEYGGGNSLHQYMRSRPQGRFEQAEAKGLYKQILEAIAYLQQKNIVHRDIKPQNILLNKAMKVKIIDFGFSLISSIHDKVVTFCGTPTYMAPEIVNKKDHIGIYADRWSLGVLLYTLLQGTYPFKGTTQKQLFKKISKGHIQYVEQISESAKKLIQKFLKLSPIDRISPSQALKDKWFQC